MGDLPKSRIIESSRPFITCGTDFAGPFTIRESMGRGRKTAKAYLCIFVCFTTKAVHLKVASSLTTSAFLACLKRFISRRGLCQTVHSDNGTNFVGANKELKKWYDLASTEMHNNAISNFLTQLSITWKFIPARSPHFGGIWEAAVKSVKRHLYRITGKHSFTFEELSTLFSQIEAILNSRPLIPLSSNPDDYNFLSPAHFLIGDSMLAIPEQELLNVNSNRLKHFQLLQQMQQQFWKKWSNDYLITLQQRPKSYKSTGSTLKLGSLVLLRDNTPPLNWRMGRVINIHPGADGTLRVVSVKTSTGIVQRAVTQLCEIIND